MTPLPSPECDTRTDTRVPPAPCCPRKLPTAPTLSLNREAWRSEGRGSAGWGGSGGGKELKGLFGSGYHHRQGSASLRPCLPFPLGMLQKRCATSPESGGAITVERIFSAASLGSPSVRLREKPGMSSLFTTETFSIPSPPDKTFSRKRRKKFNAKRRPRTEVSAATKHRARDGHSLARRTSGFATDAPTGTKTKRERERESCTRQEINTLVVLVIRPGDRRSTAKLKACSCPSWYPASTQRCQSVSTRLPCITGKQPARQIQSHATHKECHTPLRGSACKRCRVT